MIRSYRATEPEHAHHATIFGQTELIAADEIEQLMASNFQSTPALY
jgi:hypothetical protein